MEEVNVSDDAVGEGGKADAEQHSEENEPPTDALAENWLSRGHRWVGRRVRRFFDVSDGFLDGTIARWLPASGDDAALWHVVHDDGDEEDLEAYEVRAALIALEKKWKKEPSEEEVQRALDAARETHLVGRLDASPACDGASRLPPACFLRGEGCRFVGYEQVVSAVRAANASNIVLTTTFSSSVGSQKLL